MAEQELEKCIANGGLCSFSCSEEDIRQQRIPVPPAIGYHPFQHALQGLVKLFHKAVCLGMVDQGLEVADLQEVG